MRDGCKNIILLLYILVMFYFTMSCLTVFNFYPCSVLIIGLYMRSINLNNLIKLTIRLKLMQYITK